MIYHKNTYSLFIFIITFNHYLQDVFDTKKLYIIIENKETIYIAS